MLFGHSKANTPQGLTEACESWVSKKSGNPDRTSSIFPEGIAMESSVPSPCTLAQRHLLRRDACAENLRRQTCSENLLTERRRKETCAEKLAERTRYQDCAEELARKTCSENFAQRHLLRETCLQLLLREQNQIMLFLLRARTSSCVCSRVYAFWGHPSASCAWIEPKWLWLKKNPVPKWNPGKWKHGPKPA